MKKYLSIAVLTLTCSLSMAATKEGRFSSIKRKPASANPVHPCAPDALSKAAALLKFHFSDNKCEEPKHQIEIKEDVKFIGTRKLLEGEGEVDVLELTGFIYKGKYRLTFSYAKIPGVCVLMGQEVFEAGSPY